MKKPNYIRRILVLLLVLMLVAAMGAPALAAPKGGGGGGGGGGTAEPPKITTTVAPTPINVGETATFKMTAASKNATNVIWLTDPAGPTVTSQTTNAKNTTSTATFSYTGASAGTYTFAVYATNAGLTSAPATVTITVKAPGLNYLVLGDSIAAGTDNGTIRTAIINQINSNSLLSGLLLDVQDLMANPNNYLTGNKYRYTYQFKDYLQSKYGPVQLTDLSVPGYTTADLLAQVKVNDAAITAADVITISIGGNDILAAGAASGFTQIDAGQFPTIGDTVRANLDATLYYITTRNPDVKILLMNFLNLYNPTEQSSPIQSMSLHDQAAAFLSPSGSGIGAIFADMRTNYSKNLVLVDTYGMFEAVNQGATVPTDGTYAARNPLENTPYVMAPVTAFPARFITCGSPVVAPFLAWGAYGTEWDRLAAAGYDVSAYAPATDGVTIDLYTHFYNPKNYVFGHDENDSDLIDMMRNKYGEIAWFFLGSTVLDNIRPFQKWRDVHCTSLGHSLIAKAHIDAWEAAYPLG